MTPEALRILSARHRAVALADPETVEEREEMEQEEAEASDEQAAQA